MEKKDKDFYQLVDEICVADSRYKADAYEFLMQGLYFTQKKLSRKGHVTGRELSEGLRDFAIDTYGPMVKTLFSHWGISKTDDFGNIVYNMIGKGLLSRTEEDFIEDFNGIFDFEEAFGNILRDSVLKMVEDDHKEDKRTTAK